MTAAEFITWSDRVKTKVGFLTLSTLDKRILNELFEQKKVELVQKATPESCLTQLQLF